MLRIAFKRFLSQNFFKRFSDFRPIHIGRELRNRFNGTLRTGIIVLPTRIEKSFEPGSKTDNIKIAVLRQTPNKKHESLLGLFNPTSLHGPTPIQQKNKLPSNCVHIGNEICFLYGFGVFNSHLAVSRNQRDDAGSADIGLSAG
jgi:hypothetical protein